MLRTGSVGVVEAGRKISPEFALPLSASAAGPVRKLRWEYGPNTLCTAWVLQMDEVSKPLPRTRLCSGMPHLCQRLTPPAPLPPLRR
jgi:hypothetical protein